LVYFFQTFLNLTLTNLIPSALKVEYFQWIESGQVANAYILLYNIESMKLYLVLCTHYMYLLFHRELPCFDQPLHAAVVVGRCGSRVVGYMESCFLGTDWIGFAQPLGLSFSGFRRETRSTSIYRLLCQPGHVLLVVGFDIRYGSDYRSKRNNV